MVALSGIIRRNGGTAERRNGGTAERRNGAWIPLAVIAALLALLLLAVPPAGAQTTPTDYDTDDDGLIEISSPAQLNAVRHDLNGNGDAGHADYVAAFANRDTNSATRMGCPSGTCTGYELAADLDLSTDYPTWTPLGIYTATFDGNGYRISGLTVSTSATDAGLFSQLGNNGVIRELALISPSVTITATASAAGAVAGQLVAGSLVHRSLVQGGTITNSGHTSFIGGLTGIQNGTIRASYATATVRTGGSQNNSRVGGLTGIMQASAVINASYAAGPVSASGTGASAGGLVGRSSGGSTVITNSYCDTTVGPSACIGSQTGGSTQTAAGYATSALQQPTGYAGIYLNWNIDTDGDSSADNPWDFGTSSHYPLLKADKDGDTTATCAEFSGQTCHVPAPPPTPPPSQPSRPRREPSPPPYNPAHDHPEIYTNPRHEMATSCEVRTTGEGDDALTTSTLTFDLGNYTRPITLALSLWDGTHFRSLQSQRIAMPELRQEGQTATVEVVTDPAQTRFRLDSQYGLNLVLGYADCHTDDP